MTVLLLDVGVYEMLDSLPVWKPESHIEPPHQSKHIVTTPAPHNSGGNQFDLKNYSIKHYGMEFFGEAKTRLSIPWGFLLVNSAP